MQVVCACHGEGVHDIEKVILLMVEILHDPVHIILS